MQGTSGKTSAGCRKKRRKEGVLAAVWGQTQGRNRKQNYRGCGEGGKLTVAPGTSQGEKGM